MFFTGVLNAGCNPCQKDIAVAFIGNQLLHMVQERRYITRFALAMRRHIAVHITHPCFCEYLSRRQLRAKRERINLREHDALATGKRFEC